VAREDRELTSDYGEAWIEEESGNPWPMAILMYRSGAKYSLAELVASSGVPAGGEAAQFVADVISGRYKRVGRGPLLSRSITVLMAVQIHRTLLAAWKRNPDDFGGPAGVQFAARDGGPDHHYSTIEDIYFVVADDLNMTPEAVQKIVSRNRSRVRKKDKAP
jgi:hypothetical protein